MSENNRELQEISEERTDYLKIATDTIIKKAIEYISLPIWIVSSILRNKTLRNIILTAFIIGSIVVYVAGWQTLLTIITTLGQFVFAMTFMVVQFGALFWILSRTKTIEVLPGDKGQITFDDYYGNEHLKKLVGNWVELLTDGKQKLKDIGGQAISGILLIGPPGTGKTYLARALSGTASSAFIGMSGSDFTCVSGDALVTTKQGLIPAEDILPGDVVWTGQSWQPVTAWKPQGVQTGFQIKTRAGYEIVLSPTHPLWTYVWRHGIDPSHQGKQRTTGKHSKWVDAKDLKIGDWVAISPKEVSGNFHLNEVDAYVLGLFIAEGYMSGHYHRVSHRKDVVDKSRDTWYEMVISSNNDLLKDIVEAWAVLRGFTFSRQDTKIAIYGASEWILGFIDPLLKAPDKIIPEQILRGSTKTKAAFVSGLYDGDGCAEPTWGMLIYSTASYKLAQQLQYLLGTLGIVATKRAYRTSSSFNPGTKMFDIKTSGNWAQKLQAVTKFRRLESIAPKLNKRQARLKVAEDGFVYDSITSIIEVQADFYDLEVKEDHAFCANQFVTENSMFFGIGVLKVRGMFSKARAWAKTYGATILFIDEIDAIAGNRGGVSGDPRNSPVQGGMAGGMFGGMGGLGVMSRLLVEMDGITEISRRDQIQNKLRSWVGIEPIDPGVVLVMGATNRPGSLDPAIIRPGRFDRQIEVGLPDKGSRRAIIEGYLDKISSDPEINVDYLVSITGWASPALLSSAITKDAARLAIFDGRKVISQADIEDALQENALGLENPIHDLDPEQRKQIAIHEAGHAVTIYHLKPETNIARVSIVRRSGALGYVMPVETQDIYTVKLSRFTRDIMVSLAGHVATKLVLGEAWTGATGDLASVRARVYHLANAGFFRKFPLKIGDPLADKEIGQDAAEFLNKCLDYVEKLLIENRHQLDAITEALLEHDTLSGDKAVEVMRDAKRNSE